MLQGVTATTMQAVKHDRKTNVGKWKLLRRTNEVATENK